RHPSLIRAVLPVTRAFPFFFLLRPPPRSPLFPYTTLFRSDAALGVVGEHRRVITARTPVHLVHRWGLPGGRDHVVKVGGTEVADPGVPHAALILQPQHLPPDLAVASAARRPVDQPQVHVVSAELAQRGAQ